MKHAPLFAAISLAACSADTKQLEEKIDTLNKKLDAVIAQRGNGGGAAAAPRPTRVQPDASKTYGVAITNDPVMGSMNAKVTLIEAFDYA